MAKKNGAVVKQWLYRDQLHPVAELDASGNILSTFVYATGKNVPDYMIQAGGTFQILSDQLGSPRLVVDATSGALQQRMRHDEFGNMLEDTNPGFTPFGFAGGLYDAIRLPCDWAQGIMTRWSAGGSRGSHSLRR